MNETQFLPPIRLGTFYTVWFGQLISNLGSATTSFAISLWLFTETGSITLFAISNVFYLLPMALLSPVAGAMADRINRRLLMIVADTVQALATLLMAVLFFSGSLIPGAIYLAIALSAAAQTFQGPAWSASIPLIVPNQQLGRASGMGRLSQAISRLAAPIIAGAFMGSLGFGVILILDLVTFGFAVGTLLLVSIPNPPPDDEAADKTGKKNLLQDIVIGWRYLITRRGLLNFVILISLLNLFVNFAVVLTIPLALTLATPAVVGVMNSVGGVGMLSGTLIMSTWGGPQRRMKWLLGFILLEGGAIFLMGLRPSIILITTGYFMFTLSFAFVTTLISPILQTKVALQVQGRVFATYAFLVMILEPIGHATVGPITDKILEPLMHGNSAITTWLGAIIGTGTGRGMALMFLLMGLLIGILALFGLANPRVRCLEDELPDVIPDAVPVRG